MCIINTSDSLYNTTFNTSLTRNGTVLNYTEGIGDSSVYLIFTPLLTSDIGMYECEVSVTQPSINLSRTFSNGFNISSTSKVLSLALSVYCLIKQKGFEN